MSETGVGTCDDPQARDIKWFEHRNGDHGYVFIGQDGKEIYRQRISTFGIRKPMWVTLPQAAAAFAIYRATDAEKKSWDINYSVHNGVTTLVTKPREACPNAV
jgi:hypothetical protein